MLEGKAQELFDKWLMSGSKSWTRYPNVHKSAFEIIPQSMLWGVIQDFADSLGYLITIERFEDRTYDWLVSSDIFIEECMYDNDRFATMQEARTAAI